MLDADTTTQPVASNENDVCEGRSARRAVEGETTVTRVELPLRDYRTVFTRLGFLAVGG